MSRLVAFLAVTLLATLVIAGSFWLKIRGEREEVRELQARVARLEAGQPSTAPPPVQAALSSGFSSAVIDTAAAELSAPPSTRPVPASASSTGQATPSQAERNMTRMTLLQQYPQLRQELGLSESQANEVIDLLVLQQIGVFADMTAVLAHGVIDPAAIRDIQRKAAEREHATEAGLAALLGARYTILLQYQATEDARQQIRQLQAALGTANALSESQSRALLAPMTAAQKLVVAEHGVAFSVRGSTSRDIMQNQVTRMEDTARRMMDAASPHLTFTQRQLYQRALDRETDSMRHSMPSLDATPTTAEAAR